MGWGQLLAAWSCCCGCCCSCCQRGHQSMGGGTCFFKATWSFVVYLFAGILIFLNFGPGDMFGLIMALWPNTKHILSPLSLKVTKKVSQCAYFNNVHNLVRLVQTSKWLRFDTGDEHFTGLSCGGGKRSSSTALFYHLELQSVGHFHFFWKPNECMSP